MRQLALIYLCRTLSIAAFLVLPISPASTLIFAGAMGCSGEWENFSRMKELPDAPDESPAAPA